MYFTFRVHLITNDTVSLEILDLYLPLTEFSWKSRFRSKYNEKFSINSIDPFTFKSVKMKNNLKFSSQSPCHLTGTLACTWPAVMAQAAEQGSVTGSRTSRDKRRGGIWREIIKASHPLVTLFSEAGAC